MTQLTNYLTLSPSSSGVYTISVIFQVFIRNVRVSPGFQGIGFSKKLVEIINFV